MAARIPYDTLTDEELLQRYRLTQDEAFLGAALTRHTLLLLGVAMKYLKDRDAAEDAVQQIFLKTLTHLPSEPIQNFKGWLYVLLRNYCLQVLRARNPAAKDEALQWIPADDATTKFDWKEYSLTQLEQALQHLPDRQRQAIELCYLKQHSYQQIMACTGWTFMQVKSYVQNGKRNLKSFLTEKLREADQ